MLWFPEQRFSVVCLCSNGSANPGDLARKVAEVYLAPDMKSPVAATKRNVAGMVLSAEEVHAKAGLYRREEGGYIEIVERDGKLFPRGTPSELIALDKRRFTNKDAPDGWEIEFDESSPAKSLALRQPGAPPTHFERATPVTLSEAEMKAYGGDFESAELGARYRILADAQGPSVEVGDEPGRRIESTGTDRMRAGGLELVFHRDSAAFISTPGACERFSSGAFEAFWQPRNVKRSSLTRTTFMALPRTVNVLHRERPGDRAEGAILMGCHRPSFAGSNANWGSRDCWTRYRRSCQQATCDPY